MSGVQTSQIYTVRFEEALKEASVLDTEFTTTKKIRGPLHGVPVSFKDQCRCFFVFGGATDSTYFSAVDITGLDSSIGFTQWANKPAEEDAQVR